MKIENKFVEKLVEDENPFPHIFNYLLENVWVAKEDVSEFYEQGKKAKEFEKFLDKSYFEVFTELLPKYTTGKKLDIDFEKEKLVILDMLSIREAVLLREHLEEKGFEVNLDYSFSALPSDTESFKDKIELDERKKELKFEKIRNIENFSLAGDEDFVWSSFPDAILEGIQEGRTVTSSEGEVYRKTENHLDQILEELDGDKIVITSDHGYNIAKGAYSFKMNNKDQKKVRKVMGNNRGKEKTEEVDKLVEAGYLVDYDNKLMARARYTWTTHGGKYSVYQHGGCSLMECMTPVIEVRRDK